MTDSRDGETTNLADRSHEAMQALLHSLAGEPNVAKHGKPDPELVKKISSKLTELIGEDAAQGLINERGEMLNEEGLPIIEFTEPVLDDDTKSSHTTSFLDGDSLVSLAFLSPEQREERKRERDRILDLLEEEERVEELKERRRMYEERRGDIEKRKELAKREGERIQIAKEMQKKMGKALLKSLGPLKEKNGEHKEISDHEPLKPEPKTLKKVSFAEDDSAYADDKRNIPEDLGDFSLARLKGSARPHLMTRQTLPMKADIVERFPSGSSQSSHPVTEVNSFDSDDESVPPDSPDEDFIGEASDGSNESSNDDKESILEDEAIDFDTAQHHREIALEYYNKRGIIDEATLQALNSPSQESHDNDNAVGLQLQSSAYLMKPSSKELNLPAKPKPVVSRFKADRIAASYLSPSSPQLVGNMLPATKTRTLQSAIRMGKLDSNNQLVGGAADESCSEEESETAQEILQLLREGGVYNAGPSRDLESTASLSGPNDYVDGESTSKPATPWPPGSSDMAMEALAQSSFGASLHITPVRASSPKLSVGSAQAHQTTNSREASLMQLSQAAAQFPTVVNSPSFPPANPSSLIISPSFPRQPSSHRPERPPVVMASTVQESVPSSKSKQVESSAPPARKLSRFMADRHE